MADTKEQARRERFMRLALAQVGSMMVLGTLTTVLYFQAQKAHSMREVPVGCVFVDARSQTVIAGSHNETTADRNVRPRPTLRCP